MTILLTSEVAEEIEEALYLIRELAPEEDVVLQAPSEILAKARIAEFSRVEQRPLRVFSYRARLIPKLFGLLEFAALAVRLRPRLIFSGFSMMKHRVMSRVLRVPHVSYIRGLMFNPDTKLGFSDKLRYGLLRGRNVRVLNAFEASHVLTVAKINEDFMVSRGVDRERIIRVGPLWLRDIPEAPAVEAPGRVYFVTKAFETHGVDEAHDRQIETVRELSRAFASELVIRAHPRDFYEYEADPGLNGIRVARSTPRDFLLSLTKRDVLVSPLSTMAFEALQLGVPVVFFEASGVTDDLTVAYERLGISPVAVEEAQARVSAVREQPPGDAPEVFSPIDPEAARVALGGRTA